MHQTIKHVVLTTIALLAGAAAIFAAVAWFGIYSFAADAPHSAAVSKLIASMRQRSIEVRAREVQVPDLSDAKRIVQGAGNYDAMCVGCHLARGMQPTELSQGLYPAPPKLAQDAVEPAQAFWVIKHGVKASGMPAWGKSMGDEYIWNLVAFVQQLPKLDEQRYRERVSQSGGHEHGGGESGPHGHGDAAAGDGIQDPAVELHHLNGAAMSAGAAEAEPAKKKVHTHADGKQHTH